ncbi:MAG: hypothetical protein F6K35_11170 [Okeania sp. SIO2H7]|nr:hypothetical protein [Okeania sp. SIO2H7]
MLIYEMKMQGKVYTCIGLRYKTYLQNQARRASNSKSANQDMKLNDALPKKI